jgi:phosphotransferase system enzyme I (PtsI)
VSAAQSDRLLRGIGVSPGIAMGPTVTVRWALPEVPHRVVARQQVEKEIRRLRAALKDVRRQLQELRAHAEDRAGVDEARIFDAQMLMLEDKDFIGGVAELIRENHLTAEKAFEFKTLEVRDLWTAAGNPLLKERLDLLALEGPVDYRHGIRQRHSAGRGKSERQSSQDF